MIEKDSEKETPGPAEESTVYRNTKSSESGGQNKKKFFVISVVLIIVLGIIFAGIIAYVFLNPDKELEDSGMTARLQDCKKLG